MSQGKRRKHTEENNEDYEGSLPEGWKNEISKSYAVPNDSNKCGFPPKIKSKLYNTHPLQEKHFMELVWPNYIDKYLINATNDFWGEFYH